MFASEALLHLARGLTGGLTIVFGYAGFLPSLHRNYPVSPAIDPLVRSAHPK